ncbi:Protein MAIN-LIKE 2 [Linum grandiflorum]
MERWRPEKNTFHIYHEECSITLQDVAHLTGLPVTGDALYVEYEKDMNWAAIVEEVLDKSPGGHLKGDRRVKMGWLHDHFYSCTDFGMEQPIPHTEMLEAEVMVLLGLTRHREVRMRAMMLQYLGRCETRDEHVVERGPVRDPERWHFHDQ